MKVNVRTTGGKADGNVVEMNPGAADPTADHVEGALSGHQRSEVIQHAKNRAMQEVLTPRVNESGRSELRYDAHDMARGIQNSIWTFNHPEVQQSARMLHPKLAESLPHMSSTSSSAAKLRRRQPK